MAVGKSGSAQSNSGNSSSTSNYNASGSYQNTDTSTVNTPDGWITNWQQMQPGANGLNPTQAGGVDWLNRQLNGIDPNRGATNLNYASNYFQDTLNNRTAPTLANLAASGNPAYAAPDPVVAQQIAAKTGADFMDRYKNPYTSDVIDTSLAQFDFDAGKAKAALMAGNAGAFGNKRYGLAEGEFAANNVLDRASLGANLRNQGFLNSASLGQTDASRDLTAQTTNASNRLAADTFNTNVLNNRQQFDANLGMQYNNQRDNVASTLANLGNSDYALGQGLAGGLINAAGMGQNQNLAWLNAAVPAFGQTNTSSGSNTGTTTGSSTGNQSSRGKGTSAGISLT